MRWQTSIVWVFLFAVVVPLRSGFADEAPLAEPAVAQVVVAEKDRTNIALLWRTNEGATRKLSVEESTGCVSLPPGEGCLIAVRAGSVPILKRTTLAPSQVYRLEPQTWRPGIAVAGKVTGPAAQPLLARVTLANPNELGTESDLCALAQQEGGLTAGLTDDDGHFVLGPVGPGTYTLAATAEGHESIDRVLVIGSSPATQGPGTVVLQEVADLELSFDLSEVREAPPFDLTLHRQSPTWYVQQEEWNEVRNLKLGDDAPLRLTLNPGAYRLMFSKTNTDVHFVQEVLLSPGLNIVRVRPWPIRVYGKVSKGDEAIENAELNFICSGAETSVTTSEEGEYEARLWTATMCGVFVHAPDGGAHGTSVDLRTADFGDAVELDLELPDHVVEGVVVNASTAEPIVGAKVTLSQLVSDRSGQMMSPTETNSDGEFEFTTALADSAETVLYARAEGYIQTSREIQVMAGERTVVRVELKEATGVSGRVVGPGGEPVSGAVVGCCAIDHREQLLGSDRTNPNGEFTLDAAPGVTVFAAATGYTLGWAPALDSDEETVVRLAPRSHPVLIRLLDPDGVPVPHVPLYFSSPSAGILVRGLMQADAALNHQQPMTDENGYLPIASLPPGLYQVLAEARGTLAEVGVITVPFSGEATLHLPSE